MNALAIKKTFIEDDEFDKGRRNLLNDGHTFGQAYESATHYGIPHGIAVVLGRLASVPPIGSASYFRPIIRIPPQGSANQS